MLKSEAGVTVRAGSGSGVAGVKAGKLGEAPGSSNGRAARPAAGVSGLKESRPMPEGVTAGTGDTVADSGFMGRSMAPDILVMDEPTNGLDPFARRRLIELLTDFRLTKIFTSHDLDMILELCERTIVLHDGEVRADGPTREIFRDDGLLASCRLEKPLSMQGCTVCGSSGKQGAER